LKFLIISFIKARLIGNCLVIINNKYVLHFLIYKTTNVSYIYKRCLNLKGVAKEKRYVSYYLFAKQLLLFNLFF